MSEEIKEKEAPVKKAVKKFKNDDVIQCKSITNGELLMVGAKTNILYKWAGYGDVEEVEYQDLIYEARSSANGFVTYPRFIILDEDFVAQNKQLSEIYSKLYSAGDLKKLAKASVREIRASVPKLPRGAFDSLKGIVATMITSGELDSIQKIKAFDEIFDTQMLQILLKQ